MLYTAKPNQIKEVVLTCAQASIPELVAVSRYRAKVVLTPEYEKRVREGYQRLQDVLHSGKPVYGVNTGFGDNARFKVSDDELIKLQENIIRSHGTSVGEIMSKEEVRASLFLMLVNAANSCTGVDFEAMELAKEFLNRDLYPYAPCEGTIGGLSYEPYVVMTMMGNGRFVDNGNIVPAQIVLEREGLKPFKMAPRQGLALLNLTASALGMAMIGLYDMVDAVRHAYISSSFVCEALQTTDKAFNPELLKLKKHPESSISAAWIRKALNGSEIMEKNRDIKVQDCTSIRMLPHNLGAVSRRIKESYEILMEELESVVCNPVFLPNGVAMMGFNFDSTYISMYCDSLVISASLMAKMIEAHMERLIDTKLSGLPPFLVKNPGVNSGFMIVQYVTAGLNADIAYLAAPASVANTRVSAGQETPNLLPDCTARKLSVATKKLKNMVALTILTALQASDFVDTPMSPLNTKAKEIVREKITFMEEDDFIYKRIESIQQIVEHGDLLDIYMDTIGEFPI